MHSSRQISCRLLLYTLLRCYLVPQILKTTPVGSSVLLICTKLLASSCSSSGDELMATPQFFRQETSPVSWHRTSTPSCDRAPPNWTVIKHQARSRFITLGAIQLYRQVLGLEEYYIRTQNSPDGRRSLGARSDACIKNRYVYPPGLPLDVYTMILHSDGSAACVCLHAVACVGA